MSIKTPLVLLIHFSFQLTFAQSFNKEKMDSLFNAIETNNKSMGTVVISKKNEVLYSKSIGYSYITDKEKRATSEKTKYRIASVTKMFTAVIIFQLIEEGALTLNTPLSKYFPNLPNSDKITIGHLLSHRSGLYNYTDEWDSWRFSPKTEKEMIAIIKSKKPLFKPDSKTSYSNSNYIILGYIIEKIDKKPYKEAIKTRITSKLGLNDTYYGSKTNIENGEAFSYGFEQGLWKQQPETDMSVAHGAGAIVATSFDLTKFISALFSNKLVSQTSLNQMLVIQDGEGMGMEQLSFHNQDLYGHSGHLDFFQSWLLYFPKDSLAIAYISNGYRDLVINDILTGILHIYFDKPYIVPDFKSIQLTTETLDKYLGVYSTPNVPLKLTITKNNTILVAQATGQPSFQLDAVEKDKFKYDPAGIIIEFNPDKNELVLKQGRGTYTFTKEK